MTLTQRKVRTIALERATNLLGKLSPEVKERVERCIANPTQATWDNAYSIVVNGARLLTLWQAVLRVAPSFCRSKSSSLPWPTIPTRTTLLAALHLAAA